MIRAAFQPRGGHEVDTQGDSFLLAFHSAKDAVLAATTAQQTITTYPDGQREVPCEYGWRCIQVTQLALVAGTPA